MLSKISVTGLFDEVNYDIVLKEGPLSYIHSQNGCGKTTVLKLVYDILCGNLEDVRCTPFQRIDLCFDDGAKLIVENREPELSLVISKNRVEEEISPDDMGSLIKATYISPDRLYYEEEEGHYVSFLWVYMNELSEKIRNLISEGELDVSRVPEREYTEADLLQLFKNLEAKINFIGQAGFKPSVPSRYRFPPSRYEIGERRKEYSALALALEDYVGRNYAFAESIVVFKDIVNSLYINKSIEINGKGFFEARIKKSGTVIPISKFSSGEKQIFVMFYRLLFEATPGSLVIFDEPEHSLHVSWQQQFGKILSDVARIRNLQLIVSTHAPAIIHNDWDLAVELENIGG